MVDRLRLTPALETCAEGCEQLAHARCDRDQRPQSRCLSSGIRGSDACALAPGMIYEPPECDHHGQLSTKMAMPAFCAVARRRSTPNKALARPVAQALAEPACPEDGAGVIFTDRDAVRLAAMPDYGTSIIIPAVEARADRAHQPRGK